ncbi:unnamed protein product, partial [Ixodes pacificus]
MRLPDWCPAERIRVPQRTQHASPGILVLLILATSHENTATGSLGFHFFHGDLDSADGRPLLRFPWARKDASIPAPFSHATPSRSTCRSVLSHTEPHSNRRAKCGLKFSTTTKQDAPSNSGPEPLRCRAVDEAVTDAEIIQSRADLPTRLSSDKAWARRRWKQIYGKGNAPDTEAAAVAANSRQVHLKQSGEV